MLNMFEQCLIILFIVGPYNAVVGQERGNVYNTPSTTATNPWISTTTSSRPTTAQQKGTVFEMICEFDSDGFCLWQHEPGARNSWLLNPSYDYDAAKAKCEAAYPFMYFEKPSSRKIGSVRMISHPYFEYDYDQNSCFSFSYKIFRNSNGSGIKVYQTPQTLPVKDFIEYSDETKKDYVLFEVWGDRGNSWYEQEAKLKKHIGQERVFQIIIEGIFDQDPLYIAIRNVSVQRCTENAVVPTPTTTTTLQPRVADNLRCGFVDNTLCGWTRYPETKPIPDEKFLPINMYIDIPQINRTAYLISPQYSRDLEINGCFYFQYELYRNTYLDDATKFVGIRVYQKPEFLSLEEFLGYSEKPYIMFEDYSNASIYYSGQRVLPLKHLNDNFQIIVEGFLTSGSKHVVISNMEILQGDECEAAKRDTSTATSTYKRPTRRKQTTISSKSPQPTRITRPTTTTRLTTTQRPLEANDSLTCGLVGNDLCGWTNYPRSIGTWIKGCGSGGKPNNRDCYSITVYMPEEEMLIGKRTAHLISPLYSRELESNGCFYLLYNICAHYYIGGTGRTVGIRAYQKPDYLALEDLLALSDEAKEDYILFEDWSSNMTPTLYEKEIALKQFDANFQIVIEAIFEAGPKFIDVSNMAIRLGSNCTAATTSTSTTTTTTQRPTTTQAPRGVNDILNCGFDGTELCGWTSYPRSIGSWVGVESPNAYDTKILKVNMPEEFIERNRTAVLISPLYSGDLEKNGCFYFMYLLKLNDSNVDYNARAIGIRVYQKPTYLALEDLLAYDDVSKKFYTIHQVFGDMGIWTWREKEVRLKHFNDDFQIIIEAILGPGRGIIDISDMMILQGSHCTSPK